MKRVFSYDLNFHFVLAYQACEPEAIQGPAIRECLERLEEDLVLDVVIVFPSSIFKMNKLTYVMFILLALQISDRFHGWTSSFCHGESHKLGFQAFLN